MTGKKGSKWLLVAILIGIAAGVVGGGAWPAGGRAVGFIGELFIRALKMLVVPLVVASMVVGVAGIGDVRKLGRLGGWTLGYYVVTTAMSVVLGLVLVVTIGPGKADTEAERIALRGGEVLADAEYRVNLNTVTLEGGARLSKSYGKQHVVVLDRQGLTAALAAESEPGAKVLRVSGWSNPKDPTDVPALFVFRGKGLRVDLGIADKVRGKEGSVAAVLKNMIVGLVPKNLFRAMAEADVLPLIVFSLIFGGVLTTLGAKGRPVIEFFEGLNAAIMKIVHLLMLAAPVGIGALIAGQLGAEGGFGGFWPKLVRLGSYAVTVMAGLAVHGFVTLPLILLLVGRRRVWPYLSNVATALTTAFSTASSSATLPLTMECTTESNGVSERTASFVLPLGATVNMDGTALYEAVAAVFIAQIYGIELGFGHLVVIFLTATLAAVGAAGIPQAGLVTMVVVLTSVKLPVEGITLILVIDWFLDRCRTTVNVWGDAVGAAVVERLAGEAPPPETGGPAAPEAPGNPA